MIAIVQLVLTHYNLPLYRRLSDVLDGEVCFVVGDRFFRGSPVSVETTGLRRNDVKNTFAAERLAWQRSLPSVVFNSAVAVLELNPRIISNLYIALRRRLQGRATIWWGHGLSRRKAAGRWSREIRKALIRSGDAVVLYDERSRRELIEMGIDANMLFVAPNSIDVESIGLLAKAQDQERRHILFIGRLVPEKKVELLLDAFAQALDRLPPETRLLVVGDGPHRWQLERRAAELEVSSRTDFLGEITDDTQLAPIFARSMLVVHPSAIGLAAIHSLAHGVPVLFAAGEDHFPEVEVLVPGENSERFQSNDAADLARCLSEMIARPHVLLAMGRSGRTAIQEGFGVGKMLSAFERALAYATSRRSGETP